MYFKIKHLKNYLKKNVIYNNMKSLQVKKLMRNGVTKVYEYEIKNYYEENKKKYGYYTCPRCGSVVVNRPSIIEKHNMSLKCQRIQELKT